MGNPFIYWGISFVCLLLGVLSQLWGNIFWLYVLAGLSVGFLLLFGLAMILEMRTWEGGLEWW